MRAGLSTIQQTLTPEASAVLTAAISEAGRRGHGQTTPLHVAATLLASPAGLLRQACLRSHPNSSHPLQCRALELCFSVALDRLPTSSASSSSAVASGGNQAPEPPISNALMAALKRAQAHQRRGCPESQQQPLLAVKVELDQLVVSILDDPGVSRVMREASFSSPAVKAAIEANLSAASSSSSSSSPSSSLALPKTAAVSLGFGLAAHRQQQPKNLYMNPKLQAPLISGGAVPGIVSAGQTDEVTRVIEILSRPRKCNPVLVGDSEPEPVMKEVIQKIERGEIAAVDAVIISLEMHLRSINHAQIPAKIRDLGDQIATQMITKGVVLDLGDLRWLVEAPAGAVPSVAEVGRAAVVEMTRVLNRFSGDGADPPGRLRLFGTATCATFLRCQVYHPTMENDWDLQALPIAPRSPLPIVFPPRKTSGSGILSSSVESLAPARGFPAAGVASSSLRFPPEIPDAVARRSSLCSVCMENYERELARLVAKEFEKSSSDSKPEVRPPLPQWLQMATGTASSSAAPAARDQGLSWKQSTEELLNRWRETCSRLHLAAAVSSRPAIPVPSYCNPILSSCQPFPPKLPVLSIESTRPVSPPASPVKTDLVLGRPKSLEPLKHAAGQFDIDAFKRLFTGITEKVSWQPEAASAVVNAVLQSKSGNGKLRGAGAKGDSWLLFVGPDRIGKMRLASALSELLLGIGPVTVPFGPVRLDGDDGESDVNLRGRRWLDRIVEAVRQNPFSMVVLEDFDLADALARGTIKRAVERGRLADSYGREVSLGNVVFILTADWIPDDVRSSQSPLLQCEEKILDAASSGWQLELSVGERTAKRRVDWLCENERPAKPRKELGLSLDLNLALAGGGEEEATEGSRNSSDLTVEHEQEHVRLSIKQPASAGPELIELVDYTIVFKPVDFVPLRRRVANEITAKFTAIIGSSRSVLIDDDVLDQMVGGVWLGGSTGKLEEWSNRVLVPRIEQLKSNLKAEESSVAIRLSAVKAGGGGGGGWLPSRVTMAVDGLGE